MNFTQSKVSHRCCIHCDVRARGAQVRHATVELAVPFMATFFLHGTASCAYTARAQLAARGAYSLSVCNEREEEEKRRGRGGGGGV